MLSQHQRLLRVVSAPGGGDYVATTLHGGEQISDVYRFDVTLQSMTRARCEDLLGGELALQLQRENTTRWFHGVIQHCADAGSSANGVVVYQCTLVPPLALLALATHNRIFENCSVIDIVAPIMRGSGQRLDTSRIRAYPRRETCTQFGENDLAFVNRLLAEEGIAYFFRQQEDSCICVLVDTAGGFDDLAGKTARIIGNARGSCEYRDAITTWQPYAQLTPARLRSVDYCEYASAPVQVEAGQAAAQDVVTRFEQQVYGQHYFQRGGEGARDIAHDTRTTQAERWLRALQQHAAGFTGTATAPAFGAGLRVDVMGADDGNAASILLTRVQHDIRDGNDTASGYSSTFFAVPAGRGFVPLQAWPRPRLHGVHSARVLAVRSPESAGANAEVRVAFAWHPTQASCWARVAQLAAGHRWGSYFVPEAGQEVLVEFLNGDPDRPVVVGALYNRDHAVPPYSATQCGIRTRGARFNELRFDACDGREQLYLHAGRDHHCVVNNDQTDFIGNNRHTTIRDGDDVTRVCAGNQTIDVGGDVAMRANGSITMQVGGSTLTIDATGVSINGTLVTLQANAQVDVSAGAIASISAGVVNIS